MREEEKEKIPREAAEKNPPKKLTALLKKKKLKKAFILSEIFRKLGD